MKDKFLFFNIKNYIYFLKLHRLRYLMTYQPINKKNIPNGHYRNE